jgi:membrane-bound metal-dependent hydrolase YbcI (DUF457 family)
VDPASHVILGRVIVAAFDRRRPSRFGPGAGTAAILGALAPDVDCVLMRRWDVYLRWHEVATHSLAGSLLTAIAVAAIVRLAVRASRLSALIIAGGAGAFSHLALDAGSGARLGLLWPLSETRSPLPLVAMADPWLMALLGAGGAIVWWCRDRPRAARHLLIGVALFAALKGTLYTRASSSFTEQRGPSGHERMFEARWGFFTQWLVHERTGGELSTWSIDGRRGTVTHLLSWPVLPDTPLTSRSRALATVRNLHRVHGYTFALETGTGAGGRAVRWSDIRFCRQPAPGTIDCGLWFGGIYDADGRPTTLVMQVGNWIQTRTLE